MLSSELNSISWFLGPDAVIGQKDTPSVPTPKKCICWTELVEQAHWLMEERLPYLPFWMTEEYL